MPRHEISVQNKAAMHDRASVNDAAMRIVKVIYPNLLDVGCFSHTLDLVGEHFHIANFKANDILIPETSFSYRFADVGENLEQFRFFGVV